MNEVLSGNVCSKFAEGVVVLVRKKTTEDTIKAFRPISLLNFDYKLLARILKYRMEKVIEQHSLLNSSQKCSNANRNIFEALSAIKDRIAEYNCRRISGRLISFDLDHAFDRVDRSFLFNVMREMRFHPSFVSLLEKIMSVSTSKLLINGNLSSSFPIQRSVRQGDPLSMHLFVIYLHPLLEKLLSICDNPQELVVAYADDISIIVREDDKLQHILQAFEDFGLCSGSVLNTSKTMAISIGVQQGEQPPRWLNMCESVKILGIVFFNSLKKSIDFNWGDVIRKTCRLMWLFKSRILSLHQKVILVNTFISSKIWFMASILSIPNAASARVTSQIGNFIWDRHPTRVTIEQIGLPFKQGGLNLHLPMKKCKALLLNRFIRCREHTQFATSFEEHMVNPPLPRSIPALYPCLKTIVREFPYIPTQMRTNPSSAMILEFYRSTTKTPKIIEENPTVAWTRVWRNIRNRQLTSHEKSTYYLLVNGKIPHAALMYRQNRADSSRCTHCSSNLEDLEHKLANCSRVHHLWTFLKLKLEIILNKRIQFKDLSMPELKNIGNSSKSKALKMFITYVNFVLDANNVLTVETLDFMLSCNSL